MPHLKKSMPQVHLKALRGFCATMHIVHSLIAKYIIQKFYFLPRPPLILIVCFGNDLLFIFIFQKIIFIFKSISKIYNF